MSDIFDAAKSPGRGQRIWNSLRDLRDNAPVSIARARLVTRAFRETEGQPLIIRRAHAFETIMREIPIFINEEQLLVGDFGARPMAPEFFPDLAASWVVDTAENARKLWNFDDDTIEEIKDICAYWDDKSNQNLYTRFTGPEEEAQMDEYGEKGSWIFATITENQTGKGWNVPDFERVIKRGFTGLIADIDEQLEKLEIRDYDLLRKRNFLIALKTMLRSGTVLANRYADLAEEMAAAAAPERRRELLTIAETCRTVPERPAQTFQQALQCVHLCHIMVYWDTFFTGVSFGRVDQYLYPYYRRDIDSGLIDRNYATELIECFRVKQSGKRNFFNGTIKKALSGETHMHNATLGGITVDGRDAVNELSFVWLDAAERAMVAHPTLSIRWHEKIDFDFVMRGIEVCKLGLGFPAWFSDTAAIEYLLDQGASLEEARNWAVGGCVLHTLVGKTPSTIPCVMNLGKIFEVTMNNGRDPLRGDVQIGLETGEVTQFESYEQLLDAYTRQLDHFIELGTRHNNQVRVMRAQNFPETFISCMFDDCIEKGDTIMGTGGRYQINCQYLLTGGCVDVGNSLAAIKKCVFDDRSLTMEQVLKATAANFEGCEDVHRKLLAAPKFGNDDDYADYIVAGLYDHLVKKLRDIQGAFGTHFVESPHSLSWHGSMGNSVGALPSGRKAHVALADGAVSPCQGTDVSGPSASINSAGKVNQTPIFGTLFNMKILPSSLKTPEDSMKLAALIRTYLGDYKGKHIQFNIVDREVLLDAQKHPERHRNLIVRVAGYSALFVELNETIQQEVIDRTAHTL